MGQILTKKKNAYMYSDNLKHHPCVFQAQNIWLFLKKSEKTMQWWKVMLFAACFQQKKKKPQFLRNIQTY